MNKAEELKLEIERIEATDASGSRVKLLDLATTLGFQTKRQSYRRENGSFAYEYRPVSWTGEPMRGCFGSHELATIEAMKAFVSRWGSQA